MEKKNNTKTVMYVIAALVVVMLVWAVVTLVNSPENDAPASGVVNNILSGEVQPTQEVETDTAELLAAEQERVSEIQAERAEVLEQKAALEAALETATSSQDQQELLEKQQEFELELLELRNQEEYPPLPNPGL